MWRHMVNETLCEKKYSIPDPGSHSRHLVNGRSQSPGHHGTTSPLVLSTHHQRPHPHAGPEDSVLPLTRLVSRAWYGISHLTTPLRTIHLPVESPRKVGALESLLQLTRPHGVAFGSVGVALACAWPEASSTSSSATSKRRFRWRIRYLGFRRSSADGHRTL